MSSILIAGGAGYIGSHMVLNLLASGKQVIVLDDLSSGHQEHLPEDVVFVHGAIDDKALLSKIFTEYSIEAVMHFAAFIQVGESVVDPKKYYQNNVVATLSLLNSMLKHDVKHFVFSSTAAIFGEPQHVPIDTAHPKQPVNPYGRSKLIVEKILQDYDQAYGLKSVCLRYFNACGSDPELRTGECHDPETHLIPLILQVANNRRSAIKLFGEDYDTPDGSCVRDYIHVNDLCSAHALGLGKMMQTQQSKAYNLGNGVGHSVKEVIQAVRNVTGHAIPVELAERRAGDPAQLVADSNLIKQELGWQPQYEKLEDIIEHAWEWEKKCN